MKTVRTLVVGGLIALLGGIAFLFSGVYPMGADVPHNRLTHRLLNTLRERSIARATVDIVIPALNKPEQLSAGGADYNEMCTECHLKPGKQKSEFTVGLYPPPPNLTLPHDGDPQQEARRRFWIIKHGIKASGMPAWGLTHDDERIWNMVAFLQRLPELTSDEYAILTSRDDTDTVTHQHKR
jgi:mono/diheme cytochrome c family protein